MDDSPELDREPEEDQLISTDEYLIQDENESPKDGFVHEEETCELENEEDIISHVGPSMTFLVSHKDNKHENEEEQSSIIYLNEPNINEIETSEDNHTVSKKVEKEDSVSEKLSTSEVITDQPPAYYTTYGNTDIQSQLSTRSGYEVTTFVTEDGQTGQIIISADGSYPRELNTPNGTITLGDMAIPSSDQLSIEEDTIEHISSMENFRVATTHNADGTTHFQYILKEDANEETIQQNTTTPRKVFACTHEKCDKQFSSSYRLKLHSRIHTGDTFTCMVENCEKSFLTQTDLQKHTKSHLGQKDFICEVDGCKKEYTTAHHLKVHKRQHSGERPFLCEWKECGKMFTTGYGLKSHFRTHTNERPYKCLYEPCSKAFKTSGDLQKHIRTHTGERPFHCTYPGCNLSFTTSNIRKVHLRTHTGEKPYKCEFEGCGRTFASATNYKNHSRIHTGERPYVCEVAGCSRRFTEYSSLYKHNIVHTQQKPYTCSICQKTYRQTSTLAMHKRTAHGSDDFTEAEKEVTETEEPLPTSAAKRPKISRNQSTSSYLQSMSLIINNGDSSQDLSARISAQNLSESTEIPGAIAIPIQVTMNPDGTIAGAPGLNLTDGNGRIIPVNLSVSIPVSSLSQVNENSEDGASSQPINTIFQVTSDDSGEITPRQASSTATEDDNDGLGRMKNATNATPMNTVMPSSENARGLIQVSDSFEESDDDPDDRDVTDKYLTSHYRKDAKTSTTTIITTS